MRSGRLGSRRIGGSIPPRMRAQTAATLRSDPARPQEGTIAWRRHCREPESCFKHTARGAAEQGVADARVDEGFAPAGFAMYGECMARLTSTTVRLGEDDIRALKKARAAGLSASELVRKGLCVVASRYYSGRRPPTTSLFESTDSKLGDESLLFKDLKD